MISPGAADAVPRDWINPEPANVADPPVGVAFGHVIVMVSAAAVISGNA